jgi:hypothetical protein
MTGNEVACAGPDARHVASRIPARALRRDSAVLMIRVLKSGAENTRSPRLSAIMRATFRIVLLETDYMSFSAMRWRCNLSTRGSRVGISEIASAKRRCNAGAGAPVRLERRSQI